jgi:hypothetical protein
LFRDAFGAQQTIETLHAICIRRICTQLWFRWKGKPLILGMIWALPEIREFFTIRNAWAWTHGKDTRQWRTTRTATLVRVGRQTRRVGGVRGGASDDEWAEFSAWRQPAIIVRDRKRGRGFLPTDSAGVENRAEFAS